MPLKKVLSALKTKLLSRKAPTEPLKARPIVPTDLIQLSLSTSDSSLAGCVMIVTDVVQGTPIGYVLKPAKPEPEKIDYSPKPHEIASINRAKYINVS